MASLKPIGEQMAALNTSSTGDTSFAADRSNSLLNATCPARIQNNTSNASFNADTSTSSGIGKWKNRPKREPLKISPLAQIDEIPLPAAPKKFGYVTSSTTTASSRDKRSDYKTRLCDAFRRQGWCPYNNNCTYAHGEIELQIPKRRSPSDIYRDRDSHRENRDHHHQRDLHRRPSRDRRDYLNRSGGTSSRRHNDDDRRDSETSFRAPSGSRHRDEHSSRPSEGPPRQICHAFQRGNCRYGPRCRYLHQEQLPQFNANATMYAAPPPESIAYYHHQNTTQTYMMPYFIPMPAPPPHPHQQYVDLNQTMPIFLAPPPQMGPPPPAYYCPPQTPIMDPNGMMLTEPIYNMPPPPLPVTMS